MRKAAFCTTFLTLLIFLASVLPAAAAPIYTCKKLPTISNMKLSARGINNAGQVSGYNQSTARAFIYKDGVTRDLGTLPAPFDSWSEGTAINDGGQVVGNSLTYDCRSHAFISGPGGLSEIGPPPKGPLPAPDADYFVECLKGEKAAGWWRAGSTTRACVYENGKVYSPYEFPPWSQGASLNTAGDMVGMAGNGPGDCQAFLYSGGILHLLGTLPAPYDSRSQGKAVNDSGIVVGCSYSSSTNVPYAFIYDQEGGMKPLGTLPAPYDYACYATGINAAGQVVGYCMSSSYGYRAWLYSGGVMYDLNDLVRNLPAGEVLSSAYGINDKGQIAANGYSAYLLSPVAATITTSLDLLLLLQD